MFISPRLSPKKTTIISIVGQTVDPLQPNLGVRIPRLGGYHSRCGSTVDWRSEQDLIDKSPRQVKIPSKVSNNRKQPKMTVKSKTPVTQLTSQPNEPGHCRQYNIPIVEHMSMVISPRDHWIPESQSMISQRERMDSEATSMSQTRVRKRLAQIVPHRIDQPYFMSGSTARLSERYKIDEEDLQRMKLRADSRTSRASSRSGRDSAVRRRINTPIDQNGRIKSGGTNHGTNHELDGRNSEEPGDTDINLSAKDQQNEDDKKREKERNDRLLLHGGNKIISTGDFAAFRGTEMSLLDGIDLEISQMIAQEQASDYSIITKKQKKAFNAIFNDIDVDMNGKVTFNELMYRMFANVSKKDAKLLMQIFDVNKDKTIDRREFVTICALNDRLCGFRTESKNDSLRLDLEHLSKQLLLYKELFSLLDQDDDNKIHIDEVMLIMSTAFGREIGLNEDIVRSVIDAIDKNSNGYIEFVSFLSYIPFFLRMYKTMMDSDSIQLQELEESRQLIREQLQGSNRHAHAKSR